LCRHYNVPLVSMRAALLEAVRSDRDPPQFRLPNFMLDCQHPNAQGHSYMAQLILSRLRRAVREAGAAMPNASVQFSTKYLEREENQGSWCDKSMLKQEKLRVGLLPLPPPLLRDGEAFPLGSSTCVTGSRLKEVVLRARDFNLTDEGRRNKVGLVAKEPGASASLCVTFPSKPPCPLRTSSGAMPNQGREVSHLDSASSTAWLGYLQSYSGGMGSAELSCLGSCTCDAATLDAHTPSRRISVMALAPIELRHPPRSASRESATRCDCMIQLSVRNQTSSRGHKFKVFSLMHYATALGHTDSWSVRWKRDPDYARFVTNTWSLNANVHSVS
jgi:hypothetical protein